MSHEQLKTGDYIYYRNRYGAHEPGKILRMCKVRAMVHTDGSGDTLPAIKWVSLNNLEPQK